MPSIASVVLDQAAAGQRPEVEAVPASQWRIWFEELRRVCPSALRGEAGRDYRRQSNALRTEMVPQGVHCSLRSPDGRGLAWLLSGGSPFAYGQCSRSGCPRCKES